MSFGSTAVVAAWSRYTRSIHGRKSRRRGDTGRVRATLIAAIVFGAACTPPAVTVSPSIAPSFAVSSAPTPSPTPPPSAGFADAPPGAVWPAVVLYTVTSDGIAHKVSSVGTTDIGRVCEGRTLAMLARADGAALLVRCISSGADEESFVIVDLARGNAKVLPAHPVSFFSVAWSPDGRSVAYFKLGDCPMPAPVCQTRAVVADTSTGAEREILSSDYHLSTELRWESDGLRMFQPECGDAGCFPPERVGTFRWDGTRFTKISDNRLIATDGVRFSLYEQVRSRTDPSDVRNVILRDGQTDRNLTAIGPVEYAIDLLDGGHSLAWRQEASGQVDGMLREYDATGQMIWDRNAKVYPPWTTRLGDAVVSGVLDGPSGMAAYIYDLRRNIRFIVPLPTTVFTAAKS